MMKRFLCFFCLISLLGCVSVPNENNVLYGHSASLEEMEIALKNLDMQRLQFSDDFGAMEFVGQIETGWKTYFLAGELLLAILSGTEIENYLQQKYIITLYENHYEIKGMCRYVDRDKDLPFDNEDNQGSLIKRNTKNWELMEEFATSLSAELSKLMSE